MPTKLAILLALGFLAFASPSWASDSRTVTDKSDSSVSAVTAETLAAANQNRRFLFIQNIGATSVWVSHTGTAAVDTAGSFELPVGASLTYEGDTTPRNAVSIISETSASKVTAYEG